MTRRRSRFVVPGRVRLDLSDGDWVEVKRRLTYAEQQELLWHAVEAMRNVENAEGQREYVFTKTGTNLKRLKVWLLGPGGRGVWSLRDDDDYPVDCDSDAIDHLDPDTAAEIVEALDHYEAELDAEKNRPAPGMKSW